MGWGAPLPTASQLSGARGEGGWVGGVPQEAELQEPAELSRFATGVYVAMEACASAHYWGREIAALGHEVMLVPPVHVKPFVKRQKNDAADAEAITEAERPTMHFVVEGLVHLGQQQPRRRSCRPSRTAGREVGAGGRGRGPCGAAARSAGSAGNLSSRRPWRGTSRPSPSRPSTGRSGSGTGPACARTTRPGSGS